jgi:hypothetical protein
MRQATCSQCGLTTTVSLFCSMNGKIYCEPCVWKAAKEAKERGQPAEYVVLQDNSVCAQCGAYSGDMVDHPIIGNLPMCSNCAPQEAGSRYLDWLKVGLAGFFVPGPIIALLTFPGVIVHEATHLFFCRLFKLQVYDVCLLRFGNPAGYVIHERTENFTALFFVSMAPFVGNTLLCVVFCAAARFPILDVKLSAPLAYFLYWLGLSIGMHAIPSPADLSNLWELAPAKAKQGNILAIVSLPLVALLYLVNLGRVVWADLGYGIAVGILGPIALLRALARV